MGKMNVLRGSGRVVLPGGDLSDEGERSWVGDKINVPTHSELRKSFILTAAILLLACAAPLSPTGISKLLESLLLVLFKDGSWFVDRATVGDGRTELAWAWMEDRAKVEGLVTSTECAVDRGGGHEDGEGLTALGS